MEIVNSIRSKVTNLIFDSIGRHIGYIWNYNDNIQTLKDHADTLKGEETRVRHRVQAAERNGEGIEDVVQTWFDRVNPETSQANEILRENETASKKCFMGLCPNLKTRYRLGRKAKKQTLVITEVREEGNFQTVSYRRAPQGVVTTKIGDRRDLFQSRELVLEEIVEALKDAAVTSVGVYGMAGVGKTTLMKQVSSRVREEGVFRLVVIATVTHNLDAKRIQQEIADWLDYKFEVDSVAVRAQKLKERLNMEEKILVILDDIWSRIELEDIGIPCDKYRKILMTSRNRNVLLEMAVHRDFRLNVLKDEEAWNLFQKTVGNLKDSEVRSKAIEVARRCAGLPVLVTVVAAALRDKDLAEWSDAIERLERFDDDEIDEQVMSGLELSYKLLKGDEIRSLFLLCAQLPPYNINIDDLFKYAVGLHLFKRSTTLKETRNRLYKLINDLKACCLLLESDKPGYVTMHDAIHKFAVSIASRDHQIFTVTAGTKLNKWPEKDRLEQYTAISLPFCEVPEFPVEFACPKVKSFILSGIYATPEMSSKLFLGMQQLQVMHLANMHLSPLPFSLKFLQNLQTMCLDGCFLEDIAIVGELRKLKVLSLKRSNIVQLPAEMSQLKCLRLLDLSNCSSLEVIPPNLLSNLEQLEDLYMGNSFKQWEKEEYDVERNNASLAELKALPNLVSLELHVIDAEMLPKDLFSRKLERYKIFIGDNWHWSNEHGTYRTLKLNFSTGIRLVWEVKELLERAEDLHLQELTGATDILHQLGEECFPHLKHLHIQKSPGIQYMVHSTRMRNQVNAFSQLESLFLDRLKNLEEIYCGLFRSECFNRLRKLDVRNCSRLKNLFPFSMARSLGQLEEIHVSSSELMQEIVTGENGDDEALEFPKLHSLTLVTLPQFMSFSLAGGADSVSLFDQKIRFPNLAELKLSSLLVEKILSNKLIELSWHIQNLTSLIIDDCGKLNYLFTSSVIESLARLKKLEICNCESMEEILASTGLGKGETIINILFPNLEFLKLGRLPKLTCFCIGNLIQCPSLKVMQIESCPQLETFISERESSQTHSTLFDNKVSFPKLEALDIVHMHKLTEIWQDEFHAKSLKVLKVEQAKELLKMPRGLQNLKSLYVWNCGLLEEVFEDLQAAAIQLTSLDLRNLPNLKHIWKWNEDSYGGSVFLDKLSYIYVWNCRSLKNLFPFSIARNLRGLEVLHVDSCGLEHIVSKQEISEEATPEFVFPRLRSLTLWILKELRSFYSGRHTLKCPVLQKLDISYCQRLKIFSSESGSRQEIEVENQQVNQPLFSFRDVLPNLVELPLYSEDATMIRQGRFPLAIFDKLKLLHVLSFHDTSEKCPLDLLQKFRNVDNLIFRNCYFKEIFPHGISEDDAIALARIRFLKFDNLPELRHIWNQDSLPGLVLPNLQSLEIWHCHRLINLAPSSASFHNLTTLDVWCCNGFINLVTTSAAKGMVNLTILSIRECSTVAEILANDGDEWQSQSEIIFYKLTSLKLLSLNSLTSFSPSATCTIKFPYLEEVVVTQCPKMKDFSKGPISTPKLQKVHLTKKRDEWDCVNDLNTTIQHLHTETNPQPSAQE